MSLSGATERVRVSAAAVNQAEPNRNDRLAAAAFLLHGPIDIGTTLFIQEVCGMEDNNPVVRRLGQERWLQVKAVVLTAAVAMWWVSRNERVLSGPLSALVLLGVLLVAPNLIVAADCGLEELRARNASPGSA